MNTKEKTLQNLLLVSGTGRNVGKTTFICQLLRKLSPFHSIVAIKISPHHHKLDKCEQFLLNSPNIQIIRENSSKCKKDSSLMLLAGANEVFYIQVEDSHLSEAFSFIEPLIRDRAIICESAALDKIIKPSHHIMITRGEIMTKQNRNCDIIVNNVNNNFDFSIDSITIKNTSWLIV